MRRVHIKSVFQKAKCVSLSESFVTLGVRVQLLCACLFRCERAVVQTFADDLRPPHHTTHTVD
jgi:hypothetical protein